MHEPNDQTTDHLLRVGSLFSGYGGLDLAVEHVFNAHTVWYCEINEPVARVFAHHWPDVPNLGDITTIDWGSVPPVDILCGGFPCQDVSTVGKRAGLAPGTRSGLWAHMAAAIETLQPGWVVIENVRGLLSAAATRTTNKGAQDDPYNCDATSRGATPGAILDAPAFRDLESCRRDVGNQPARPLRALGAVLGDLADLRYNAAWIGLPASAIGAPHPRFRVFILAWPSLPHPTRLRRAQGQRDAGPRPGTPGNSRAEPPSHRPCEPAHSVTLASDSRVDRRDSQCWGRYEAAITRWEHITGRAAPTPTILNENADPKPAPEFVEWLMGLQPGWVTGPKLGLSHAQQLSTLGNGVMPAQAEAALNRILRVIT